MADLTGPFFQVRLAYSDGRQITLQRFLTVQDAMAAAEGFNGVSGAILLYEQAEAEPMPVIIYSPDGSIEVGEAVPDDDDYEDDPWTEAEIEHNLRVSEEYAERTAKGEVVRTGDLESMSPAARAELHARVEAERAAASSDE